jgi:hypothetical protein
VPNIVGTSELSIFIGLARVGTISLVSQVGS